MASYDERVSQAAASFRDGHVTIRMLCDLAGNRDPLCYTMFLRNPTLWNVMPFQTEEMRDYLMRRLMWEKDNFGAPPNIEYDENVLINCIACRSERLANLMGMCITNTRIIMESLQRAFQILPEDHHPLTSWVWRINNICLAHRINKYHIGEMVKHDKPMTESICYGLFKVWKYTDSYYMDEPTDDLRAETRRTIVIFKSHHFKFHCTGRHLRITWNGDETVEYLYSLGTPNRRQDD